MYPYGIRGSNLSRDIDLVEPKFTVNYLEDQVSNLTRESRPFHQFALLPPEIQIRIWEFTLPDVALIRTCTWEGSTTLWPIVELPPVRLPGYVHGRIPKIPPIPDPEEHPVALHVCQASREVATKHMCALKSMPRYQSRKWYDYVSKNDVVDLDIGRYVIRRLGGPRNPFQVFKSALRKAFVDNPGLCQFPDCHIEDDLPILPNPFFDFARRKYCVLYPLPEIAAAYCLGIPQPSDYNIRKGYVAMRLSDIEEYILGSKITIGEVPPSLSYDQSRHPWSQYRRFEKTKQRPFNLSPMNILFIYSHVLHELAFGIRAQSECLPSTRYTLVFNSAKLTQSMFEALMHGKECPACNRAVLPRIKEVYGQSIDLKKIEILVLSSRTLVEAREGHWETVEEPDAMAGAQCENT